MSLEFYRDMHKTEFDRRDALATRSSAIIAGLTTLGGVIGYLVVGLKAEGPPNPFLWALLMAAGLAVAIAAAYLIVSYMAEPLQDLDKPTVWRKYLAELTAEYQASTGAFPTAEAEFEDHLMTTYAQATDKNIEVNTLRGYRLVNSNRAMLAAFILVVLAALVNYYTTSIPHPAIDMQKVAQMVSNHESLICVPTGDAFETATKPGTRPVPNPRPKP